MAVSNSKLLKVTTKFEKKNFDEVLSALKDMQTTIKSIVEEIGKLGTGFDNSLKKSFEGLSKEVKDLRKDFDEFKKKSKETFDSVKKDVEKTTDDVKKQTSILKDAMSGIWSKAKIYAAYRMVNMVATSIRDLAGAAVDLESAFANIQAITSASDAEMDKLRSTILRVGEASKYSVEEIANATTMLGQAGLSADEINNVLETTTQLAAGTGSSLQNTVDLMTSALAVWGLNSEEASHLSDVMVTGMNRTKATLETFRMAVQYAGATMASLNVSFDEFASVAAAASNAGLRASVVGTGLRAMTSELISPTKKMVKGLAELGLSTEDVNIESQGLVNVLYKLKNAGLTAANAYDLFGKRAAQFVLAAQGQLKVVDELQVAFTESGATLKAYGTQMDTISAQWTALGNTIKESAANTLDSISGLIKGTLRMLNDAIQNLMWLFSDKQKYAFNELNKQLKDEELSAKSFYDFVERLSERNYGEDIAKAGKDLNEVIDKINEKFGTTIKYVDGLEDIGDAFERIKNEIKSIDEGKIKKLNLSRSAEKSYLLSQVEPSFSLQQARRSAGVTDRPVGDDLKNYTRLYLYRLEKGADLRDIEKELKNITDEFDRKLKEEALNNAKNILETLPEKLKSNLSASENFKKRSDEITKDFSEINNLIATEQGKLETLGKNYDVSAENIKNLVDSSIAFIKEIDKNYVNLKDENDKYTKEANELLSEVTDEQEQLDLIGSARKSKKDIINAIVKFLQDAAQKVSSDITFGASDTGLSETIENYINSPVFSQASAFEQYVAAGKRRTKKDRTDRRTAREIERQKAVEFNKKYQNLKLQSQADSYAQDIAEARRKGVMSKLQTQDTTGTLSSYYSSTAADLSKLESLKTALSNKETLEKYKKDYGDLFNQVKSGKVTLEDADNKTASLIKEMLDLDKNVEQAEAEFGNLNDVDLSDLNGQITTLQDKLRDIEESGESEFGKLKEGFKATIESMSKSYGSAKLGSMIAEDLGNGISDALYSIGDGTKSMKEAFSDMARSVLEDISKMLIKMAVLKAMEGGMGFFGTGGSVEPALEGQAIVGGTYAKGGFIPKIRAAAGTAVRGGIQGKDSVPAMLMPGEYVLKKSAVDALGTNFLNDLNNNAAQTLTNTSANLVQNNNEDSTKDSEPAVVNVWVVSKEEEASMGPNDVIATISRDIMTGGTTKRLIQQVVAGRK